MRKRRAASRLTRISGSRTSLAVTVPSASETGQALPDGDEVG